MLKSYLGQDSKDAVITLFSDYKLVSVSGVNINTCISLLTDITPYVWFSSMKIPTFISSDVELEPDSEVPFRILHDCFPIAVYGKTPFDFWMTAFFRVVTMTLLISGRAKNS